MAIYQNEKFVDSALLMKTLEYPSIEGESLLQVGHKIQECFLRLQSDVTTDPERLAKLEWKYLGFLDGHPASPVTLHRILSTRPTFFADVVTLIFRSDEETEDSREEPSDDQKARAENAYRLLAEWTTVPGLIDDRAVDEQALLVWVTMARKICRDTGHLGVCDERIGEVLAHAPSEPDGNWPCIPVRDVIDEVESNDLVRGFELGILNKRPVVMKSPTEGGNKERDLAQKYLDYAKACEIEWPTTASALRRVAEHYEEYARREDEEAQERSRR
jgi:hypothetical protein